jgi:uncharacterized protein DUF6754
MKQYRFKRKSGFKIPAFAVIFLTAIVFILFPGFIKNVGAEIQIPEEFTLMDTPSDRGETLLLSWPVSESEEEDMEYIVLRSASEDGETTEVATIKVGKSLGSDMPQYFGFDKEKTSLFYAVKVDPEINSETKKPVISFYRLQLSNGESSEIVDKVVSGIPKQNWFRKNRLNSLCFLIFMLVFLGIYISKAQRNPDIFLRKIPGIDAVDEAVGRATEMGKPILYSTGYYDITELSTICSVNILAHVAKKVAQYDSRLIVPCKWPVAMTVCQEVVREAYINAGRPDAFNIDDIFFVAGEQFSYTIGVNSLMVREKPAANFFLGTFAAEALILAETGASTGAIQIAGTDSNYQIPFFVVACDYCLIGEELYAASAYLARNPKLVGSLKAQDSGKLLLFILLILGTILVSIGAFYEDVLFLQIIRNFFLVR